MHPLSAVALAICAIVGLVLGWLLHPVSERVSGTAPLVTLTQLLALYLLAAIVGITAWSTWRAVQVRRERMPHHQAVNRLVLGRACALVGAVAGGGYLGYGLSWFGEGAELADDRIRGSAIAVVACVLLVGASVLLERACRVRSGAPKP